MSEAWTPEMVAKFGPNVRQVLIDLRRSTSLEDAKHMLRGYNLSDQEMRLALAKVPATVPIHTKKTQSPRSKFNAAMWLAGASYRVIGRAQGVSHQSIADGVKRQVAGIGQVVRRTKHINEEMVRILWQKYHGRLGEFVDAPLVEVVDWLCSQLDESN